MFEFRVSVFQLCSDGGHLFPIQGNLSDATLPLSMFSLLCNMALCTDLVRVLTRAVRVLEIVAAAAETNTP